VSELLALALQTECLGRFAEARESLRRVIALDGGPVPLDARLRLGRLLIGTGQESDQA
jgi:hypothetical protein